MGEPLLNSNLEDGTYIGAMPEIGVVIHKQPQPFEKFVELDLPSDKIIDFAKSQIGKPYDFSGIFGFVTNRDWQEPDSWFCSELVAAAINTERRLFNTETSRITPRDISIHPLVKEIK